MNKLVGIVVGAVCAAGVADVQVAPVFSDAMVLQRETEVPVWGWAQPGEQVSVTGSWGGQGRATTDDRGHWRVNLPTPEAGGPHTLTIQGDTTVTLSDVLIGEVWLCSGQSNMEMPLANIRPGYTGVDNAEAEIAAADYPEIRLLTVPNTISLHGRADLDMPWAACSPDTVRTFSATGYFFARKLHEELGIPIGVISADWGGTRIEAWMSPETLGAFDVYSENLGFLSHLADPNARTKIADNLETQWWNRLDTRAPGRARWKQPSQSVDDWATMELPRTLDGELAGFDGILFLRRSIELDGDWAGKPALLSLGPIDDMDDTWVNGVHVGSVHESGRWNEPRNYEIPAGVLVEGENVIAIRMYDTSGPGGVNGTPEQMAIRAGGDEVSLAGAWSWARGHAASQLPARQSANIGPNTLTALYHGMIVPISPYGIQGAIWYQGESNRGNAAMYDDLMAGMIANWREDFERDDMPFYYVQIAPFGYGGDQGQTAALREAQRRAMAVPHTGMAVTMDIGDERDIHPTNKQEVGRRLALWALNQTYEQSDVVPSGPLVTRAGRGSDLDRSSVYLVFDHGAGLELREGTAVFEVAGTNGTFHVADVEGITQGMIRLRSSQVSGPVQVRYAWSPTATATLFNGAGLPASPFLMDVESPRQP